MSTLPAPGGGGGDDVVVTDRQLFDSAISDPAPQPQSEPQPEPSAPPSEPPAEPPQEPQQEPQQPDGPQPRNERGQFAPRQPQPQQQAQPQQPQPQQPPGNGQQPPPHQVPLRELLDERERRYRIQAEHDQMRRAWEQLQYQQQQAALAQQQQQMPQTIYDNPDMYLVHNVVNPLRQEGHMAMLAIKDGLSREMANAQFGEQNVATALNALASFRHTPDGDHLFRQIMSSGHPYGALVRWFHNARAQQAIGPDPNAWVQRQRQAWLDDEQMQVEAARRYYAKQQRQQPQQQARVQGGPNVQLPPSLSSLPASSGRADAGGDLSDAHLWRFATR